MTRGLRSIGNSVEEKTPATGKLEKVVEETENGEPIIDDGQHTPEPYHHVEGEPRYRSTRRFGTESCGRKAVATPPEDRISVESKEVRKPKGGGRIRMRIPDKPSLIRVISVPDFRETHFQPGNRRRKETLRRSR